MKLYHYALFFFLICIGFFLTAHITTIVKLREEANEKTEYDCLVSAVNAATDAVFSGNNAEVTKAALVQAEEVFFRTLEVLWYGTADGTAEETLRKRIPCIVVFSEDGYYRYAFEQENGYGWSELVPYDNGEVPACFFEETEELLSVYHDISYTSPKRYRVEQAEKGIWEQEISPPCVFAIYAPVHTKLLKGGSGFVYAASGYERNAYYVTADNYCHLASCEEYKRENAIACYSTQKESAEAGAMPCEKCLR